MSIEVKKHNTFEATDNFIQMFRSSVDVSGIKGCNDGELYQINFGIDDLGGVRMSVFGNSKNIFLIYDANVADDKRKGIDKVINRLIRFYRIEGSWDRETHDRSLSRLGVYALSENDSMVHFTSNPYREFDEVFEANRSGILKFYQESRL